MPDASPAPELGERIGALALIDHHVHSVLREAPDRERFGNLLNEADTDALPGWLDPFASQLGFAVRRWCAPLLGLAPHASGEDYWARRCELGNDEVNRRLLRGTGTGAWFVDTGFRGGDLLGLDAFAGLAGTPAFEIVRLEPLAEELAAAGVAAADYPDRFRTLLAERSAHALGSKSILAYRCGLAVDLSRPGDAAVRRAYGDWAAAAGRAPRLVDPTLIAFGVHEALELGLPVQFHVGLGDRDMRLIDANPLHLTDFLASAEARRASILLLHCHPYEREAGYLAQGFANVYLDVGLALQYLGARAAALVERVFELAPFQKVLFSTDGFGIPELHLVAAAQWRRGLTRTLSGFVTDGEWSLDDALTVAELTGRDNIFRAYPRAERALADAGYPIPSRRPT